jgi:histone deacetylase complex regulatory component SIN3
VVELHSIVYYKSDPLKTILQEINLVCSGRNELARSVLNDEWVSHPTWATEEASFVAHKKNVNEDALHACEQERHEFDVFTFSPYRCLHSHTNGHGATQSFFSHPHGERISTA